MSDPLPKPDHMDLLLATEMINRTAKITDSTLELAVRLKAAREFMAWSAAHVRTTWTEWQDASDKLAHQLNQDRMAFDRETKAILGTAKDIRDFFNSPEYVEAHDRLKEAVFLLGRFSDLKADGTLDAFADFILKVQK